MTEKRKGLLTVQCLGELARNGPARFRQVAEAIEDDDHGKVGVTLRRLRAQGYLVRRGEVYSLTDEGRALLDEFRKAVD